MARYTLDKLVKRCKITASFGSANPCQVNGSWTPAPANLAIQSLCIRGTWQSAIELIQEIPAALPAGFFLRLYFIPFLKIGSTHVTKKIELNS